MMIGVTTIGLEHKSHLCPVFTGRGTEEEGKESSMGGGDAGSQGLTDKGKISVPSFSSKKKHLNCPAKV
jgi:hypothetical protein